MSKFRIEDYMQIGGYILNAMQVERHLVNTRVPRRAMFVAFSKYPGPSPLDLHGI